MTPRRELEIIAELHPQHGGDMGIMREMIRAAKLNGADVAKFQLYDAEPLLGSDAWNYLQLDFEQTRQLAEWCSQDGIEFMASVFDAERLEWLEELGVRRHKIASRTVLDASLCQRILDTGKPTFISLGAWEGPGLPFSDRDNVSYLYCKSEYPAMLERITDFPADFAASGLVGHSDHSLGITVPLLAIARGATVIEKHFSLDKMETKPTEKAHVCSMTPPELADLRRIGGELLRTLGVLES